MAKRKKSNLREKLHKILGYVMAVIAVIVVVGVFGGAYYFVVAPNLVSKPAIEKPFLPENSLQGIEMKEKVINSSHINYLINEIGGYKLKKPIGTESYPIIEFVLTDMNEIYYAYIKDNKPITKKGNAKNEDIIIKGNQKVIFNILKEDNVLEAVKEAADNGKIQVELIADMKTLAVKGYLSLYDGLK